MVSVAF